MITSEPDQTNKDGSEAIIEHPLTVSSLDKTCDGSRRLSKMTKKVGMSFKEVLQEQVASKTAKLKLQ